MFCRQWADVADAAVMLSEFAVAVFLLTCVIVFFSINLHNIVRFHRRRGAKAREKVERPFGLAVALAALGTIAYFAVTLLFLLVALAFAGFNSVLSVFPFGCRFPFIVYVQVSGFVFTSLGYSVFIWSVIARGKYAVSWTMPENHELVTWGPYHYVRHPSYLGYILMFTGLFLLWPGVFTFFPLLAIPGYYQLTFKEERLLTLHFGEKYREYQRTTGRLVPRFRRKWARAHTVEFSLQSAKS